ncbi:pepsin/retropepsin-like aspartic protease family protein [Mangrovicoccus ximenensis]|uniref:hypothetical protein n=1 Tax=Mangrovicoccus ximenensis TaxID=1911570 RepID=UPI000D33B3CD
MAGASPSTSTRCGTASAPPLPPPAWRSPTLRCSGGPDQWQSEPPWRPAQPRCSSTPTNGTGTVRPIQARVNHASAEEAQAAPEVVLGTFPVNSIPATVLFEGSGCRNARRRDRRPRSSNSVGSRFRARHRRGR